MKWMCVMVLAAFAAGCAGPSGRDDSDAMTRAAAKRELERECRFAAQTRTYNPDCPQPDYEAPGPERGLPPPPPVRLPGT